MKSSLKQRTIKGSLWTVGSYGTSQVIRLGSNLILTRLLFPEVFGLMALVNVFIQGLGMISDVGIGPSIIQNKKGDEADFYNSAWTLQVIRGLILWLCACCIAWPAAYFYDELLLLKLIPITGFSVVISGFSSTKIFTANRRLTLGYLSVIEFASQAVSVCIMIALAWYFRSIWALVVGNLIGSFFRTVLSQFVLPGPVNHFVWNRSAIKAIFSFGKWIFISSILNFIAMQGDKLILGKFFDKAEFGVYVIAVFLIEAQSQLITQFARKVAFPLFSHVAREEPNRLSEILYRARRPVEWFAIMMAGVMITCGNLIVDFLYDDRYAAAGWMVQIFAIRLIFGPISNIGMRALVAIGKPSYDTYITVIRVLFLLIGVPLGFQFFGITGGVWCITFSFILSYPFVVYFLSRHSLVRWNREVWCTLPLVLGLAVGGVLSFIVGGF